MAALTILQDALNSTSTPLAFNLPQLNATTSQQFASGQSVNVSWTTPFELTTVEVWQGPLEDGTFARQTIAANFTRDDTSTLWTAIPLGGDSSTDNNYHFRLQKGDEPNTCPECIMDSPTFQLQSESQSNNSSTSESSPMPSTSSHSSSYVALNTKLAIGLGIGLGMSFAIGLLVLLVLWLRRQEKRMSDEPDAADAAKTAASRQEEEANVAREAKLRYSSGNDSTTTQASTHPSFHFEESPHEGLLSIWQKIFGR